MNSPSSAEPHQAVLEYDFEESIGYWIVLTSQAFQKALNDELSPHGVTYRQSQVLGRLALEGELSQVELAARMMIEPATLVDVLDRMERDQLIRRSPAAHDRRRNVIQADRAAKEVWDKVVSCAQRVREQATQGLTDRQLKTFTKTLKKVLSNLRQTQSDLAMSAQAELVPTADDVGDLPDAEIHNL